MIDPIDDPSIRDIIQNDEAYAAFWKWVVGCKAHDNPRGDFIRDTRGLVEAGIDPATRIAGAPREARAELGRLLREFDALSRNDAGGTGTGRTGFGFAIVMVDSDWSGREFGVVVCDDCRPAFDATFPEEMFARSKADRADEIPGRCVDQLADPHFVRCGRAPDQDCLPTVHE